MGTVVVPQRMDIPKGPELQGITLFGQVEMGFQAESEPGTTGEPCTSTPKSMHLDQKTRFSLGRGLPIQSSIP